MRYRQQSAFTVSGYSHVVGDEAEMSRVAREAALRIVAPDGAVELDWESEKILPPAPELVELRAFRFH